MMENLQNILNEIEINFLMGRISEEEYIALMNKFNEILKKIGE